MSEQTERLALLDAFMAAWNRHDVDDLMAMMADDCRFYSSAGIDQDGAAYIGREAVRRGYAALFDAFPDARWCDGSHLVDGDKGLSEWTFKGTKLNGEKVAVRGCDVFVFSGKKIAVKDSFRKAVLS